MRGVTCWILGAAVLAVAGGVEAAGIDPALQAKINAKMHAIRSVAADPVLVQAVRTINAAPPAEYAAMTQEKWAQASVLDPFVRGFAKNEAAGVLRAFKTDDVSEAFVSAASGVKVAFLTKPTNWSHKGKPKHEGPMAGRAWQGEIETDESTGVQQIQVGVPVLDGGKPIGSLVVGLSISKLR